MTFVNTVEYANAAFNPFDINLDGWGEQVSDDIDSYDEIFSELYEKYKGGKLAPEIALLLRLGFSAAVVNFTNRALSSATPGFNDVIRQSPELMKMFTNATVNSMAQQSPGFAFANNLVNPEPSGMSGPPPKSIDPRTAAAPQRPGMVFTDQPSSRPDINAGRGVMFSEAGIDLNNKFDNVNDTSISSKRNDHPFSYLHKNITYGPHVFTYTDKDFRVMADPVFETSFKTFLYRTFEI
jgi:hypothetical protein